MSADLVHSHMNSAPCSEAIVDILDKNMALTSLICLLCGILSVLENPEHVTWIIKCEQSLHQQSW